MAKKRSAPPEKFIDWLIRMEPNRVAKKMGLDPSAVRHWRLGTGLPSPKHMRTLVELSGRALSYEEMIESFFANRAERKKKAALKKIRKVKFSKTTDFISKTTDFDLGA